MCWKEDPQDRSTWTWRRDGDVQLVGWCARVLPQRRENIHSFGFDVVTLHAWFTTRIFGQPPGRTLVILPAMQSFGHARSVRARPNAMQPCGATFRWRWPGYIRTPSHDFPFNLLIVDELVDVNNKLSYATSLTAFKMMAWLALLLLWSHLLWHLQSDRRRPGGI